MEGFRVDPARLRFHATIARHKANSALWDAQDSGKPVMDLDQCLQLSRDFDAEMQPIKTYAMDGLERRAPVPQTRLGFRVRRRRKIIFNAIRRKFGDRFENKPPSSDQPAP